MKDKKNRSWLVWQVLQESTEESTQKIGQPHTFILFKQKKGHMKPYNVNKIVHQIALLKSYFLHIYLHINLPIQQNSQNYRDFGKTTCK